MCVNSYTYVYIYLYYIQMYTLYIHTIKVSKPFICSKFQTAEPYNHILILEK